MSSSTTIRVGLTGGVASGKSTVAECLRKRGIPVFDLDRLGRDLLDTDLLLRRQVEEAFGPFPDGIDRKKLREIIFADKKKRQRLENLLHPLIWKRFEEEVARLPADKRRFVICEAPLLIETGNAKMLDALIVVLATEKSREKRLTARDNISMDLARQMLASQTSDEVRRQNATYIINNDDDLASLEKQIALICEDWEKRGWR